jgi:hypothetical protein
MRSRIATKVINAAVVALVVELADIALDKYGPPAARNKLVKRMVKSGVAVAAGVVLGKVLSPADDAGEVDGSASA